MKALPGKRVPYKRPDQKALGESSCDGGFSYPNYIALFSFETEMHCCQHYFKRQRSRCSSSSTKKKYLLLLFPFFFLSFLSCDYLHLPLVATCDSSLRLWSSPSSSCCYPSSLSSSTSFHSSPSSRPKKNSG